MRTIHKFEINQIEGMVSIPENAEIVLFGDDMRGIRCFWALLDPGEVDVPRGFKVFPTGRDIPDLWKYHKSYIDSIGYVWHLCEAKNE